MEANKVGSWTEIGYNAPGTKDAASSAHTNNFSYTDALSSTTATWTATAKTKLNDCDKGNWIATATSETNTSTGNTYVDIDTDGTAECIGLTPSFTALARSTAQ